jgi:hypothetical protein
MRCRLSGRRPRASPAFPGPYPNLIRDGRWCVLRIRGYAGIADARCESQRHLAGIEYAWVLMPGELPPAGGLGLLYRCGGRGRRQPGRIQWGD